ncbi:MAG TPA: VanZ family protein [Candidatus Acidoferrum sp.]|nr:VanZ family protein [Candidatus Acidoferrum sp.]
MPKFRVWLKYWLPVLVWMAVIFTASSDTRSFVRSSRILAPLLHWLFPQLQPDTIDDIVLVVRKGAHLTEYAILALLLWRAVRKPVKNERRTWSWPEARLVLLSVALYAASDEFHQLFVASRDAAVHDVLIDTVGGAAGLAALWRIGRWRNHW